MKDLFTTTPSEVQRIHRGYSLGVGHLETVVSKERVTTNYRKARSGCGRRIMGRRRSGVAFTRRAAP